KAIAPKRPLPTGNASVQTSAGCSYHSSSGVPPAPPASAAVRFVTRSPSAKILAKRAVIGKSSAAMIAGGGGQAKCSLGACGERPSRVRRSRKCRLFGALRTCQLKLRIAAPLIFVLRNGRLHFLGAFLGQCGALLIRLFRRLDRRFGLMVHQAV